VRPQFRTALAALHAGVTHPVTLQASTTLAAIDTTTAMKAAGYTPAGVTYPTSDLGKGLRDLARLIKANVGLQIACLDYGDWDMHHDIGTPGDTRGWMHRQLADVAASLAAFVTDLGTAMGRVSVVTLSEFGRRAAENGSGGADHGYGQAVLLLGGGIVGGKVHGRWPTLAATALDQGDVAGTTDYRSVLGELLQKRCGISASTPSSPASRPHRWGWRPRRSERNQPTRVASGRTPGVTSATDQHHQPEVGWLTHPGRSRTAPGRFPGSPSPRSANA